MAISDLGGYCSINRYVRKKINRLQATDKTFSALYEPMFS